MAAGPRERVHRTRPTGQLARRPTWEDTATSGHAAVAGDGRWLPGPADSERSAEEGQAPGRLHLAASGCHRAAAIPRLAAVSAVVDAEA